MPVQADSAGQLELLIGAALLYAAGRACVEALAGPAPAPGRRAIAHSLPIAAAAGIAIYKHEAFLALAIIFATSVASLSLASGFIALMGAGPNEPPTWPAPARKIAGHLLPVTVLTVLAGLSGHWDALNSAILAAQGILLLFVWLDPTDRIAPDPAPRIRPAYVILAAILLALGSYGAITGILTICKNMDLPPPAVVATLALSPLLVGPMLLGGAIFAQRGQAWTAHAAAIGVVQINLCVLLPAAALAWWLKWHEPLSFPMANWRVEAFILVLLAAALLPIAAARWRPAKLEGFLGLAIYIAYIAAVIAVSARS